MDVVFSSAVVIVVFEYTTVDSVFFSVNRGFPVVYSVLTVTFCSIVEYTVALVASVLGASSVINSNFEVVFENLVACFIVVVGVNVLVVFSVDRGIVIVSVEFVPCPDVVGCVVDGWFIVVILSVCFEICSVVDDIPGEVIFEEFVEVPVIGCDNVMGLIVVTVLVMIGLVEVNAMLSELSVDEVLV